MRPSLFFLVLMVLAIRFDGSMGESLTEKWRTKTKQDQKKSQKHTCRLWMGPSSTSTEEEPKLGLFAGVDFDKNESIGDPEVGIPFVDFTDYWKRETQFEDATIEFLEGFLWTAEYAGAKWEGNFTTTVLAPGPGVLANYHSGTHNIDWDQKAVILRGPLAEIPAGKEHPARSAITPYYNMTMRATQRIRAGMELFANFGDVWDGNKTEDVYGDKLTRWNYMDADKVLDKILAFMKKHESAMSREKKEQVLDFLLEKVLVAAGGKQAKVVRSLIPAHPGKLQAVKDMGGTFNYRNPDLVKTQYWLERHAVCVDTLKAGTSTIPEAGRGAFTKRSFAPNEVIAPVPLLQIASDRVLDMFEIIERGNEFVSNRLRYRGKQIVTNYAFGHPESTALFVPVSPTVTLINHGTPDKVNAQLRWSVNKHWGNAHDMLERPINELPDFANLGLVMEAVALRDIKDGEEIFIDYGSLWQAAWDEYIRDYNSVMSGNGWPLKAVDVRAEFRDKPYRTLEELDEDPYPLGVDTACFILAGEMTDGEPGRTEDGIEISIWEGPIEEELTGVSMYSCDIWSRAGPFENGDDGSNNGAFNPYNYTVMAHNEKGTIKVVNVPHFAVLLVDDPYTSDIHMPGAFRHYIGIPDRMFPQAWRDRRR